MRRTIFAAVPLAVLALAAPAAAKGPHATTYKAKVVAVQAAPPVATPSKHGAKKVHETGVRGQAKLVDGKRDKVQLQVKGLEPGATYTWSVRSATGDADACSGDAVDAFEYGDVTARRHGNTKARARSREFSAEDGSSYAVVLTDADGNDVACGVFLSKADRRAAKRDKAEKAHGKGKHEDQGDDDAQGDEQEQGDDDQPAGGDDPAGDDGAEDPSGSDDPAGDDDPEVDG